MEAKETKQIFLIIQERCQSDNKKCSREGEAALDLVRVEITTEVTLTRVTILIWMAMMMMIAMMMMMTKITSTSPSSRSRPLYRELYLSPRSATSFVGELCRFLFVNVAPALVITFVLSFVLSVLAPLLFSLV